MTIGELILCSVVFGVVSLLTCRYLKRKAVSGWGAISAFFPGFVLANIASWPVSRPGDRLLQPSIRGVIDLPVMAGFPFSFYQIGGWGQWFFRLQLLPLITNIAIVAVLGIAFARSCEAPTDEPEIEQA